MEWLGPGKFISCKEFCRGDEVNPSTKFSKYSVSFSGWIISHSSNQRYSNLICDGEDDKFCKNFKCLTLIEQSENLRLSHVRDDTSILSNCLCEIMNFF
ncbi:unnamed protein product [Moneuplotes crassus]|uniref:Uncharacterized protein n=1 Tax=Euplotes crassus TaxID=5936 RepID=A0AAD1UMY0_EUPCR|nr:unnamed protein product [Moneuplotes crassus]